MAGLTEIVTSTWEYREKTPSDAIADHVPLYFKLREKGRILEVNGGRVIWENIRIAQNQYVQTIDPTQEIVLGYNQTLSGFEFSPKIVVVPVVVNALERAQNQGDSRFLDLVQERLEIAETSLINKMEAMSQGDGSGNGGRDFAGIQSYIIKTDTGSIGGISRVTVSAVRNVHVGALATWGAVATSAANIESRVRYVKNQLVRNTDKPSLLLAGSDYFNYIGDAMSAKQRYVQDAKMAEAGFDTIVIEGLTAVLAGGKVFSGLSHIGTTTGYFLNTDTFALKFYKGYNMAPMPERVSVNQLVDVSITAAIGNLTMNNPALNGMLYES